MTNKYINQLVPDNQKEIKVEKKDKTLLKGIGSVLFALIASGHHWIHTLLIALGFTALGSSILLISPTTRLIFLFVSLLVSLWFIVLSKRKWKVNRPSALVYLGSSIISIALVLIAIPQTLMELTEKTAPQEQMESVDKQQIENTDDHEIHHN